MKTKTIKEQIHGYLDCWATTGQISEGDCQEVEKLLAKMVEPKEKPKCAECKFNRKEGCTFPGKITQEEYEFSWPNRMAILGCAHGRAK